MAVAGLERSLERAIRSRLRRMKRADYQALFEGSGPLSTMSGKILMGYALGLYGPQTRHDLEIFNEIRNAFAHAAHNLTFKNRHLTNRTTGLHCMMPYLKNGDAEPGRDAFMQAIRRFYVPFSAISHNRSGKTEPLFADERGRSVLK
jgi:DNA-binding MltR family transcriptional regulator